HGGPPCGRQRRLGGSGSIHLDVDVVAGSADQVYIDGNFVGGDSQSIYAAFTSLPTSMDCDPVVVAVVTGDADENSFVAGNAIGFSGELLDFSLSLLHEQAGGQHVFSVGFDFGGLGDGGVLAATVAPGVHSLAGTSIGTLRQRVGVMPHLDDIHGLGPWVRWFECDG